MRPTQLENWKIENVKLTDFMFMDNIVIVSEAEAAI